eukprot:m.226031 g.226031  ORF g.226031 m.226031 type:complete len:364 (+) comp22354_c9_seq9:198-1289(+)
MFSRLFGKKKTTKAPKQAPQLNGHAADVAGPAGETQLSVGDYHEVVDNDDLVQPYATTELLTPQDRVVRKSVVDKYAWDSEWFLNAGTASRAEAILSTSPDGQFVIYPNTDGSGSLFLHVRFGADVLMMRLLPLHDGVVLEMSSKVFSNLSSLVRHYSQEVHGDSHLLPCRLVVQSPADQQRLRMAASLDVQAEPQWGPEEVSNWVGQMGHRHHAAAFLAARVDGPALLRLDNAALQRIGVESHAERLDLLEAIELMKLKLEGEANTPSSIKYTSHYQQGDTIYSTIKTRPTAAEETNSLDGSFRAGSSQDGSLNRTHSVQTHDRKMQQQQQQLAQPQQPQQEQLAALAVPLQTQPPRLSPQY